MSTSDKMREALIKGTGARTYSGSRVQRLVGFWVMLHTVGGASYRQLELTGFYGSNVVATQRREFRKVFGIDALDWYPELATILRESEPRA